MHKLSPELSALINQECKGRKHIKLTIATLAGEDKSIRVFNHTGEIANENHTYEIGSITKTVTTSLLAKLVYEGKMSLDDSIAKYVEGLAPDAYYPTLRRLATHTAGYEYYPFTLRQAIGAFIEPMFTGTRFGGKFPEIFDINEEKMKSLILKKKLKDKDYPWQYSNFGIGLVGHAIGVASGRGYLDATDDFLANDLGMKDSYTGIRPDTNLRGFAKKDREIDNWDFGDSIIAGAGCISSTAADMLTYARIQMNEELPYLKLCHQKHAPISKNGDSGLAWLLKKDNNHVIMHSGGTSAFHSFLAIDKHKKIAILMMANYLVDLRKFVTEIVKELEKAS